jgi:hypothetical protein
MKAMFSFWAMNSYTPMEHTVTSASFGGLTRKTENRVMDPLQVAFDMG